MDEQQRADRRYDFEENVLPRIDALIGELQNMQKAGPSSREIALGITKLEEARLWLKEHLATTLAR